MTAPHATSDSPESYGVGVVITPYNSLTQSVSDTPAEETEAGVPGFEETWGGSKAYSADRSAVIIARGEEAVYAATDAIAKQIVVTAQRIADEIGAGIRPAQSADALQLDSVQISFGVTLTAGMQALFTAQAGSSAKVTITLSRRSADSGSSAVRS